MIIFVVSLQRSSISPGDKYSRPRTPQETHHSHHSQNHHDHPMHIKKMKKEQDKDIGHVSVCTALLGPPPITDFVHFINLLILLFPFLFQSCIFTKKGIVSRIMLQTHFCSILTWDIYLKFRSNCIVITSRDNSIEFK